MYKFKKFNESQPRKTTHNYITVQLLKANNKDKYLERSVLVFYCCLINYHEPRGLKQCSFIISQYFRSEIQVGSRGFSTQLRVSKL